MSYLSRREIDELKPSIEKIVYKAVGANDSSVLRTATDCVSSGYDKKKIADKLGVYLDSKKASRLAEKIIDLVEDHKTTHRSKKRTHEDDRDRDSKRSKNGPRLDNKDADRTKSKSNENTEKKLPPPSKNISIANITIPTPSIYGIPTGLLNRGDADKARKIAQLQAQIKTKLSSGIIPNIIQIGMPQTKPAPLILDEDGRTIDKSGKTVQLTHVIPTLKANMRAMKRDQFKGSSLDKLGEENGETRFIDPRIGIKPATRNKRALRFHEPGKFQQLAERLRMKAQLEKLQNEISQIAKKTGISSATKLALIAKSEGLSEEIPQMEWWKIF